MHNLKNIWILLLLLGSSTLFAQEEKPAITKKNQLNFTLAGSGIGVSLNYGRNFLITPKHFIEISVGVGSVPFSGGLSVAHQITYNMGENGNFLELGLGGTYWQGTENATANQEMINSYHIYPIIGYRKQFKNNILFKAYINPLIHLSGEYLYENNDVVPYGGLSIGYSF
ncbi:MAG: hypothetical protein B7C24_10005 [Bacteroidetes bacterium 4572_77]|nr:MAG: hypothetical protein B7C24_10005 [Bacteroidetes bacterium 4572_77]